MELCVHPIAGKINIERNRVTMSKSCGLVAPKDRISADVYVC